MSLEMMGWAVIALLIGIFLALVLNNSILNDIQQKLDKDSKK